MHQAPCWVLEVKLRERHRSRGLMMQTEIQANQEL